MEKSKLLGIAGGALAVISTFLPFISIFGISTTLMAANSGQAILVIILGAVGAALLFKGGKTMSIISLVCGVLGLALTLYWLSKAGGMAGIGLYLMPVAFALVSVGGFLGMKSSDGSAA